MKGIDYVIKKTAAQLDIPEQKVDKVVMEYWDSIYKKLLKAEQTTVTVRHIGSFTISRFKLNNFIQKVIDKIRRVRKTDKISLEKKQETLDVEYKRLKKACLRRNELAILFKETQDLKREKKKENERNKRLSINNS